MTALGDVLPVLRCPVCQAGMRLTDRRLACAQGHSFDVARQGYVNFASGGGGPGTGDRPAVVAARSDFLSRGHYAPIAEQVASAAGSADRLVLDLAGGTGYYLAAVLDRAPRGVGVCLDLSAAALRRAARAHPRAAAVGADAWQQLPIATGAVTTVLSIFGPRNPSEIDRVLAEDGRLIVVAPMPDHLSELVTRLGMIGVDPRKDERQAVTFERFRAVWSETISYLLRLDHGEVAALVGMGPTAAHVTADVLSARIAGLPPRVQVTVAVRVTSYVR